MSSLFFARTSKYVKSKMVLLLTSSPPFRAGIPTVVFQLLRWVRVADRLTARFTWHALRASPALI